MTTSPDKPDRISPGEPLIQGRPAPMQAPAGDFESLMQGSAGLEKGLTTPPPGLSPAQVQSPQLAQQGAPSFDSVLSQVSTAQDSFANLQNKLNTKGIQLTNSQKQLLKTKLSNSTTYLRAANEKLGAQAPAAPPLPTDKGPIARFFNYISDGETQLEASKQQLIDLQTGGKTLKPADLMLVQIKMSQAQQELDYSSMLLSKVVSGITQLLNTQL